MTQKIDSLFYLGEILLEEEAERQEKEKAGELRAGNAGLYSDGIVTGCCPRLALVRLEGYSIENKAPKARMFAAGRRNEDSWEEVLVPVFGKDRIKRESEIPIRWKLPSGVVVSGRPDVVILKEDKTTPLQGIELKRVSSIWTALSVLSGKPKSGHLIQTGHYSWKLGDLPYALWYTSDVDWDLTSTLARRKVPARGTTAGEAIEWVFRQKRQEWDAKKILPFRASFSTTWNEFNELAYRVGEGGEESWRASIVTKERIQSFYEHVEELRDTGKLGARPVNLEVDGSEGTYKPCDYCACQPICEQFEEDAPAWWNAVRERDTQLKAEREARKLELLRQGGI